MAAALQELISQNDSSGSEKDQASGGGGESTGAFLEVIHLLTKMAPEERAALVGLLKALG